MSTELTEFDDNSSDPKRDISMVAPPIGPLRDFASAGHHHPTQSSLREVAQDIVAPATIDWTSETEGYVPCPGDHQHVIAEEPSECRIWIDGVPTVFCFHDGCELEVRALSNALELGLMKAGHRIECHAGNPLRAAPSAAQSLLGRRAAAVQPEKARSDRWQIVPHARCHCQGTDWNHVWPLRSVIKAFSCANPPAVARFV